MVTDRHDKGAHSIGWPNRWRLTARSWPPMRLEPSFAVVAVLTRTVRSLVSEPELTAGDDSVPTHCVANFDNLHTPPKGAVQRRVAKLPASRMSQACRVLLAATGC